MAETKKLHQKVIKRTLSWLMIICCQPLTVNIKNSSAVSDTAVLITPAVRLELTTT